MDSFKNQEKIRAYYEKRLQSYQDALFMKDICAVTGYSLQQTRLWREKEYFPCVLVRNVARVAKDDLLDFLSGAEYGAIAEKSKRHERDIAAIFN